MEKRIFNVIHVIVIHLFLEGDKGQNYKWKNSLRENIKLFNTQTALLSHKSALRKHGLSSEIQGGQSSKKGVRNLRKNEIETVSGYSSEEINVSMDCVGHSYEQQHFTYPESNFSTCGMKLTAHRVRRTLWWISFIEAGKGIGRR